MRLKAKDLPAIRVALVKKQGGNCPLCGVPFSAVQPRDWCVDHNHATGAIRGVLCRNCNGLEGKIFNLANRAKRNTSVIRWVTELLKYWKNHEVPVTQYVYPTYKTADEKRIARNTKARKRRAAKKDT